MKGGATGPSCRGGRGCGGSPSTSSAWGSQVRPYLSLALSIAIHQICLIGWLAGWLCLCAMYFIFPNPTTPTPTYHTNTHSAPGRPVSPPPRRADGRRRPPLRIGAGTWIDTESGGVTCHMPLLFDCGALCCCWVAPSCVYSHPSPSITHAHTHTYTQSINRSTKDPELALDLAKVLFRQPLPPPPDQRACVMSDEGRGEGGRGELSYRIHIYVVMSFFSFLPLPCHMHATTTNDDNNNNTHTPAATLEIRISSHMEVASVLLPPDMQFPLDDSGFAATTTTAEGGDGARSRSNSSYYAVAEEGGGLVGGVGGAVVSGGRAVVGGVASALGGLASAVGSWCVDGVSF